MHEQQHFHVVGNFVRRHLDGLHVVGTLQLRIEHPRRSRASAAHGHRVHAARNLKRAHYAEHGLFRRHHARNGAGDLVFELPLFARVEERLGLLRIEHRHAEAEVNRLAAELDHAGLDAVEFCGVLGIRVRLWIELLDYDFALRCLPEFIEQILHDLRVVFQKHRHLVFAARGVKAHLHGRIELGQNFAGAARERVGFFLGQIDPGFCTAAEEVHGNENDGHHSDADD